jgi:hydroxymethylbilane synthase
MSGPAGGPPRAGLADAEIGPRKGLRHLARRLSTAAMSPQPAIRIGTRGSPLALAQARETGARLVAAHAGLSEADVALEVITTTGDRIRDRSLRDAGGKGLFTKEIEEALLDGRIDLAVHSMKDMPTELPPGLEIVCLLPREDARDAFLSPRAASLAGLPEGAVIGSSSLRRAAQVRHIRPDLTVVEFRGNVQTRLKKLDDGVADATFLACCGLKRLGLEELITCPVEPEVMLPAVAQGAIGIEIRGEDQRMRELLAPLDDVETGHRVAAERALLAALDGSCRTPIAALAVLDGDRLQLRAQILRPDGSQALETGRAGPVAEAAAMGRDAGEELRLKAGPGFFDAD